MKTMDMALIELYRKGEISIESALAYSVDREILLRMSQLENGLSKLILLY